MAVMDDTDSNEIKEPEQARNSEHHGYMGAVLPVLIVVVTVIIAGIEVIDHRRHTAELQQRIRSDNRLKMESIQEHVEEYFGGVYSDILYISLDVKVKAMNGTSRNHIQALFDHKWERHRLSEIYVIERGFDGTRRPFMTFEYGSETHSVEEMHSPEREEEEYRVQIEQIQSFITNPTLKGQVSPEIRLCLEQPNDGAGRGVVYSVPIFSADDLVGIVAAMIPRQRIEMELSRGHLMEMAVLVNEHNDIYTCEMGSEEVRALLCQQLQQKGVADFFAEPPETFGDGKWDLLSTPVNIISEQRWWLAFLCDKELSLQQGRSSKIFGAWGNVGGIILIGSLLALFVRATYRRLEEKVRFLRERGRAAEMLKVVNEQLTASNQQFRASEQQLKAANHQLNAANQQLRSSEQQLKAANHQLNAVNQQLRANEQELETAQPRFGRTCQRTELSVWLVAACRATRYIGRDFRWSGRADTAGLAISGNHRCANHLRRPAVQNRQLPKNQMDTICRYQSAQRESRNHRSLLPQRKTGN